MLSERTLRQELKVVVAVKNDQGRSDSDRDIAYGMECALAWVLQGDVSPPRALFPRTKRGAKE